MSDVTGFDATQSLPPDVMYDALEGVIPILLKHVLKDLIENGFLTLRTLNERLAAFPFCGNDK